MEKSEARSSCQEGFPRRYVICSLLFFALGFNYLHRFAIGLLITQMVAKPVSSNTTGTNNRDRGEFHWDEYTQGLILSSFFWGFLVTQIPGGMLAERVGGKYTLALTVLVSSACSVMTPEVARRVGPQGVVAVRVVMGLGQGFESPSINELLSKWVPIEERGKLASMVFAGLWSALMYVSMCVGAWASSVAVQCLLSRNVVSATVNRKIFATIALTGSAAAILCASYSGIDRPLFVLFMILATTFLGSECAGVKLNSLDLSPNYAGSIMGLLTMGATLGGLIPPYIVGFVVSKNTVQEWRYVFLTTGSVMVVSNVIFLLGASGNIQAWNDQLPS